MSELLKISNSLVSVQWLHQHRNAINLIILDATLPKVTAKKQLVNSIKKRIPNAHFFDIKNVFSDPEGNFPNTILSPEDFEKQAQSLGINKDSCIVVYDDHGVYSSPRAWWSFKAMGFDNVAVLDGGLPQWIAEGLETVVPEENSLVKGNFKSDHNQGMFVNTNDVLRAIQDDNKLVLDARSLGRYHGTAEEPRIGVRGGHIPNSKSFPYADVLSTDTLKSKEALKAMFAKINPDAKEMIFSCGTGITACVLALAADLTEYTDFAVYDGSWTEWGSLVDLPIEK